MNERLFRERRHMTSIETRTARLDGFRLCFTVAGGRRPGVSAPANIKQAPGAAVHGVLYLWLWNAAGMHAPALASPSAPQTLVSKPRAKLNPTVAPPPWAGC